MNIRLALAADAPEIAELSGALGYNITLDQAMSRLLDAVMHDEVITLVAEVDGQVVAWMQAVIVRAIESGMRVEIVGLVVSEAYRRSRIAANLVARAEAWGKSLGAPTAMVRSNSLRQESHHFYPAVGYQAVKTQTVYSKSLD